jgi:hypothetical protein
MKLRWWLWAVSISVASGFVYSASVVAGSPVQLPSSGDKVILGKVVEGLSRTPVAGAVVTLVGSGGRSRTSKVVDANGDFAFLGIASGTYDISASKSGYWSGTLGQRRPNGDVIPLQVDQNTTGVELTIPVWPLASLSGAVRTTSGEPLAGRSVVAFVQQSFAGHRIWGRTGSTTTNAQGTYRIANLLPGTFRLMVSSPMVTSTLAEGYPTTFFPATRSILTAVDIALSGGEDRTGVDVHLAPVPFRSVSGFVSDGNQRAEAGVGLELVPNEAPFGKSIIESSAVTKADGSFTFHNVSPGDYTITLGMSVVSGSGAPTGGGRSGSTNDNSRMLGQSATSTDSWVSTPVHVSETSVSGIRVDLIPKVRIAGQLVLDAALQPAETPRFRIDVFTSAGMSLGTRLIEPDGFGNFTTEPLPGGSYFVRLPPSLMPARWAVVSASIRGRDALDSPIEVSNSPISGLVIHLSDKVSEISGLVRKADGNLAPEATVVVFPAAAEYWVDFGLFSPRMRSTRVKANGSYQVRGLPPGDYLAVAVADELLGDWQNLDRLRLLAGGATKLKLALGEARTTDLRFTLNR